MKKIILLFFVTSGALFASGGGETDIVPRVINFLIFASLVYYLLAEPVKNFFGGRSEEIASSFESIQKKLKAAKDEKLAAEKDLEDARAKAAKILADVKEEAVLAKEKLATQAKSDIEVLNKQKIELMEIERNHMVRAVVKKSIEGIFSSKELDMDRKSVLDSLIKKVA